MYVCGRRGLESYTRFVFDIFAERIGRRQGWVATERDREEMWAEERAFFEHGLFYKVSAPDGTILATIRAVRNLPGLSFPTERLFDVNIDAVARRYGVRPDQIWHSSQMAVDFRAARRYGIKSAKLQAAFQRLIKLMIDGCYCYDAEYVMLESDPAVDRFIMNSGYGIDVLSEDRDYIGQTHVSLTYEKQPENPVRSFGAETLNRFFYQATRYDQQVEEGDGYTIYSCGRDGLEEYTRFAFDVFAERIGRRQGWVAGEEDWWQMWGEEREFFPFGHFYKLCAMDGVILATLRGVHYRPHLTFTTEKEFGMKIEDIARRYDVRPDQIVHGSQLACDYEAARRSGMRPGQIAAACGHLIRSTISAAVGKGARYTVMESDRAMDRFLGRLGYGVDVLSEDRDYIGQTHVSLARLE